MPPQSLKSAAARQTPHSRRLMTARSISTTIESLFFAYRDFVSDPDDIQSKLVLRRADHRVSISSAGSRHDGGGFAGHAWHHQAEPRPRAQTADRRRLHQADGSPEDRRQRRLYPTPPSGPRTGAGAQRATIAPHRPRARRSWTGRAGLRAAFLAQMRSTPRARRRARRTSDHGAGSGKTSTGR